LEPRPPTDAPPREKKCWPPADRLLENPATRPPIAPRAGDTGKEPRITLPLRSMFSPTGMEWFMRPLAKSTEETCVSAFRT
jgi:hypothetical protein